MHVGLERHAVSTNAGTPRLFKTSDLVRGIVMRRVTGSNYQKAMLRHCAWRNVHLTLSVIYATGARINMTVQHRVTSQLLAIASNKRPAILLPVVMGCQKPRHKLPQESSNHACCSMCPPRF